MKAARITLFSVGVLAVSVGLPGLALAQTKLELKDGNVKIVGALTAKDAKDPVRNQPSKVYTIGLKGGQAYQIDMTQLNKKSKIDPFLRLEDSEAKQLAEDDDGGGFPNARIMFNCPADGTYRIIATSFLGSLGAYALTVKQAGAAKAVELVKGTEIKLTNAMAEVTGQLTKDDAKDTIRKTSVCKVYTIKLAAGKDYQIDMVSKAIDAFLRLEDEKGKQLAQDDDGGDGLNARILFNAPAAGTYRIIATTFLGGLGDFTLTVKEKAK